MITLTSNEQAEKLIKNGVLDIDDDIEIAFDGFNIDADIRCDNLYCSGKGYSIKARNITATGDIKAIDIEVDNIAARFILVNNIKAGYINSRNLSAVGDIIAGCIDAEHINGKDIMAYNITAVEDIEYFAVCFAYKNIKCKSIRGTRENCKHFCLDGKIETTGGTT